MSLLGDRPAPGVASALRAADTAAPEAAAVRAPSVQPARRPSRAGTPGTTRTPRPPGTTANAGTTAAGASHAVRAVPVPFSASSAYTQRSLLHAYTTPSRTTGEPVISPPDWKRHLGVPVTASSV